MNMKKICMRVCLGLLSLTMPLLSAWSLSVPSLSITNLYSRSLQAAKQNPAWTAAALVGTSALVCGGLYAWYKINAMSVYQPFVMGGEDPEKESNAPVDCDISTDSQGSAISSPPEVTQEKDTLPDPVNDEKLQANGEEISAEPASNPDQASSEGESDYQSFVMEEDIEQDDSSAYQSEIELNSPGFEGHGSHLDQMGESRDGQSGQISSVIDGKSEIEPADSTIAGESESESAVYSQGTESEVTQDEFKEIQLDNTVNDAKNNAVNKIKKGWNSFVGAITKFFSKKDTKATGQNQQVSEQLLEQKQQAAAALAHSLTSSQSSYHSVESTTESEVSLQSAESQTESETKSQLHKDPEAKKLLDDCKKAIDDHEDYKQINVSMVWATLVKARVKQKIKTLEELSRNLDNLKSVRNSTSIVKFLSSKLNEIQAIKDELNKLVADIKKQLQEHQNLTYLDKPHFNPWRPY